MIKKAIYQNLLVFFAYFILYEIHRSKSAYSADLNTVKNVIIRKSKVYIKREKTEGEKIIIKISVLKVNDGLITHIHNLIGIIRVGR